MVHAPTALGLFARGAAASSKLCSRWYLFPLSNTCKHMCFRLGTKQPLQRTDCITQERAAAHNVWMLVWARDPGEVRSHVGQHHHLLLWLVEVRHSMRMCNAPEWITST